MEPPIGRDIGLLWKNVSRAFERAAQVGANYQLTSEAANRWPNRLIRDAALPPDERLKRTNITNAQKGALSCHRTPRSGGSRWL
jgi:hypothetical protein